MSMTLAGIPMTHAANTLARSALPDAPVVPDRRHTTHKDRIGRLLRTVARWELRLAERIAPMPGSAPTR